MDGHTAFLVEVEPGLHVVEDYYRPIFFVQACFWSYDGDRWLRSGSWLGPWLEADPRQVPATLRELDAPQDFALFHGSCSAARQPISESGA